MRWPDPVISEAVSQATVTEVTPADCGLLDENPADVAVARAHAIEHGISAGRYGLARQGQP